MSELLRGVGDLGRGFRMWITSPRLMLLGALPALIVGVVFLGLFVALVLNIDALAALVTPFAAGWETLPREGLRLLTGVALLVLGGVLLVLAYSATTLTVGDPFYERISRKVEERMGGAPPDRREPLSRTVARAVGDGVRLVLLGASVALLCFAVGFIPVAGAPLAFVLGALLGGRLLAVELTGYAFDARGRTLSDRRRTLAASRGRNLGFGAAAYLLFLQPFVAVVAMPAAVAGATLLSRDLLGEPRRPSDGATGSAPPPETAREEPPREPPST